MKNSDIAALVLIASLSAVVAYFVATAVIGKPANETVKVKTIAPITADVETPNRNIFNKDAINPTVEVVIGDEQ